MDALTYNKKKNQTLPNNTPLSKETTSTTSTTTGTSPRQYSTDYFDSGFTLDNNMNKNSGFKKDSVSRPPRQDSMSFYTNLAAHGGRFSTDSNSSINNYLNFSGAGDQPAFDPNGRGMSIINNMFLPPSGSGGSISSFPPNSTGSLPPMSSSTGSTSAPGNDYNTFNQFRRPSEQLEPFNPQVKLKMPSFSKRGSIVYPTDTPSEFDFFNKRDSVRTRQSSFLNPPYNEAEFDFFAKRDSIKNEDEARDTRSEPDTNGPPGGVVPERPQTASDMHFIPMNAQQYIQPQIPQQPQVPPPQQQPQQPQVPPQIQQQQFRQPPVPGYDFNDQYTNAPPPLQQQPRPIMPHQPLQQQQPQQIPPAQAQTSTPKTQQKSKTKRGANNGDGKSKKQKTSAASQQPVQQPPPVSPLPARRNAIQPFQTKDHTSPLSPTVPQYNNNPEKKLITAQETAVSDDGRPLLGATKVDQLMLVIQARKKGIHKQIPQADDGSIMDEGNGVLPQQTELIGGSERTKTKAAKHHECSYCHKTFTQSTHLEVHVRSHIGYKPFACEYCDKRFTQGGNLRTHMRLHTGEKPYKCEECGRDFSRKGNLAAHKLTHENLKPYECKLDNCGKAFTQLGNLKAHQNRFHLETLNMLTKKLAETDPDDNTMTTEERELLEYFAGLYKNSNRGIKGRGRKKADGSTQSTSTSPVVQPPPPARRNAQAAPVPTPDFRAFEGDAAFQLGQ